MGGWTDMCMWAEEGGVVRVLGCSLRKGRKGKGKKGKEKKGKESEIT